MAIRDLLAQIASGWSDYRSKNQVDREDPVYQLVVEQLPEALRPHLKSFDTIVVQGSTGAGNITAAPWIALFDSRITTSATSGFYVVYLFSVDLSTITLCIAFGTTQFEQQFGGPAKSFPRMRSAAARLQEMFRPLIPSSLSTGSISLGAGPSQKLHYSYQQASILSVPPYDLNHLPADETLLKDLVGLVRLYTDIVSDPLDPSVERLVEAVVEPANIEVIEAREFELRDLRIRSTVNTTSPTKRRYSPQSRKVGDAGERVVLRFERERLSQGGRKDLADRVRWHGPEGEFCGWDITSFDDDGGELFIEVKSSVGKTISCVSLTVNEWLAACDPKRCERYCIYIVTSALSSRPQIECMRNPKSYVDNIGLGCEAIVYELQLGIIEKAPRSSS
jgi:hypothetical protein